MSLTVHYSIIMALYWSNYAVLLNYASVYLLGHGFRNTEIGVLIALAALSSALTQPLIGSYADRPGSPSVKKLLLMETALFLLFTALIPTVSGRSNILLFIAYALAALMMQNMLTLTNSLGTVSARAGKRVNFGIARGIGSLAYAITSIFIGKWTAQYGIEIIPWIAAAVYAALGLTVFLFPFKKQTTSESQVIRTNFLQKYPQFTVVLLASILLYMSHSLINNFMFQIISSKGGNNESLGVAFAIAAITELPMMFFFSRLLRHISAGKWLLISGFAFVLKCIGTLLAPNVISLYGVQLLQIFSYAVITVASVYYTDGIMASEDAVKGQAYFAMTSVAGSVLGSAVGGWMIDASGIQSLLFLTIIAALAGTAVMWYAHTIMQHPSS